MYDKNRFYRKNVLQKFLQKEQIANKATNHAAVPKMRAQPKTHPNRENELSYIRGIASNLKVKPLKYSLTDHKQHTYIR